MNIAIIGAGSVGGNLARGWVRHGHKIVFGVRDPRSAKLQPLLTEIGQAASAAPVAEAVAGADVVVFATPWEATLEIARRLPLGGRVVIDATNPLRPNLAGLAVSGESSGGEELAKAAPGVKERMAAVSGPASRRV